ncbi:hypothetical protein PMAYCL1PPCAC_32927, partial [Pristionchus mayeri]
KFQWPGKECLKTNADAKGKISNRLKRGSSESDVDFRRNVWNDVKERFDLNEKFIWPTKVTRRSKRDAETTLPNCVPKKKAYSACHCDRINRRLNIGDYC